MRYAANHSRRLSSLLVPAIGALVIASLALSFWMWSQRSEARIAAERERADTRELTIAQARISLAETSFDLLLDQLDQLRSSNSLAPNPQLLRSLQAARDELAATATGALGQPPRPVIRDALAAAGAALEDPNDLWALEEAAIVALAPDRTRPPPSAADAYLLGSILANSPSVIVADAMALDWFARHGEEGSSPAADYASATAEIALAEPGWLGPDAADPFLDGYLPGHDMLQINQPELLAALTNAAGFDAVWRYDRWTIDGSAGAPPLSVDELTAVGIDAQAGMRQTVSTALADQLAQGSGGSSTSAWLIGSLVALLAGSVLAISAIVVATRRTRALVEQAHRDPLTGAANRRLLEEAKSTWAGAEDGSLSVLAVDIDRFKLINDTWGHRVGDEILQLVVDAMRTVIRERCRPGDVGEVVRLGGDEFALLLSTDAPQSEPTLERLLRDALVPARLDDGSSLDIEISVGVVTTSAPADLDSLLTTADLRAYDQKRHRGVRARPAALDLRQSENPR